MVELITIHGNYKGKELYQPGLVFRPTEQVIYLVTKYAGTFKNTGTARKYLKEISFFLNHYVKQLGGSIEDVSNVITNFERYVHRNDIEEWMQSRADSRDSLGKESPQDITIEAEAKTVAIYLKWAKDILKNEGITVPYDGGRTVKRVVHIRKDTNFFAGAKDTIVKEEDKHDLSLSGKPKPGTRPKVYSKTSQKNGRCIYKPDELNKFLSKFPEVLWKVNGMLAYITGLRPHELLAVPRYAKYDGDSFFTTNPDELRVLRSKNKKGEVKWLVDDKIPYEVYGKGGKDRTILIDLDDLINVMDFYEPFYQERRKFYERKTNTELPPHLLWLRHQNFGTKGMVQYCLPKDNLNYDKYLRPLREAVKHVRKQHNLEEEFGHTVDFYALRHTYATEFLKKALEADRKLQAKAAKDPLSLLKDFGLRRLLRDQLGHEDFDTTIEHYIDNLAVTKTIKFPSVTDLGMKLASKD